MAKSASKKAKVGIAHRNKLPETPAKFTGRSLKLVKEMVAEAVDHVCDFRRLVKGKSVFLKPNLVRPRPGDAGSVVTDLRVVLAAVELSCDAGAKTVTVGEKPGFGLSSKFAFRASRLKRRLAKTGAEIAYLDECDVTVVPNEKARIFRDVLYPSVVLESDVFINLPRMKTHTLTTISIGIKNLYGLVADAQRLTFHRQDINQKLVDILRIRKPTLTVVDALWPVEGQAPLYGEPIKGFNVIVAGRGVVAVDTVCADMMGLSADEIDAIRIAGSEGMGCTDLKRIKIVGAHLPALRRSFKRPVVSSAGVFPNVLCIEAGACKGCLSNLRHNLDYLASTGELDRLPELTVFVGIPMPGVKHPCDWPGDLWLFGNCAAQLGTPYVQHERTTRIVPGCPPHIFDLATLLKTTYLKKR